jgi:transcriptional regulator with XRE-family HTH domain
MLTAARNKAGLSRNKASQRLYVGARTLADYENGNTIAPPTVVLKMAEVYGSPNLPADYCSTICPIGQTIAHSFEKTNLAVTVLGVLEKFNDVKQLKNRLISIAADGRLAKDERPEFEEIMREIVALEKQIGELKLFAMRHGIEIESIMPGEKEKEKAAFSAAI